MHVQWARPGHDVRVITCTQGNHNGVMADHGLLSALVMATVATSIYIWDNGMGASMIKEP